MRTPVLQGADSTPSLLGIPGTVSPCALTLRPRLRFEEWDRLGMLLRDMTGGMLWWVGDWYLYGETAYGERASQAEAISDALGGKLSPETVRQASWVAERFPAVSRLTDVDWGTHQALAGIEDPEERVRLLGQAAREKWTRQQARDNVRLLKRGLPVGDAQKPPEHTFGSAQETTQVTVGQYVWAWYAEAGMLVIQARDGRGVVLDRAALTPEARTLLVAFLGPGSEGAGRND